MSHFISSQEPNYTELRNELREFCINGAKKWPENFQQYLHEAVPGWFPDKDKINIVDVLDWACGHIEGVGSFFDALDENERVASFEKESLGEDAADKRIETNDIVIAAKNFRLVVNTLKEMVSEAELSTEKLKKNKQILLQTSRIIRPLHDKWAKSDNPILSPVVSYARLASTEITGIARGHDYLIGM